MKLKRKKIGDRSYNLVDVESGVAIAHTAQTGEHGRDHYPWEWSMLNDRIFGKLDYNTGRSVESLRDAVDAVESGARQHGILAPAGQIEAHTIREGQVFKWNRYLFRATQNAYFGGMEEVTITANNYKGELTEVKIPFEDQVTIYLPEREARRTLAIAKAKEQREQAVAAAKVESALAAMVRKLDEKPVGNVGYITNRDELIAILNELTPLLTVAILETNTKFNAERGGKDISVEIKLGFTLERNLL